MMFTIINLFVVVSLLSSNNLHVSAAQRVARLTSPNYQASFDAQGANGGDLAEKTEVQLYQQILQG